MWRAAESCRTLTGHSGSVSFVAFSPDGQILASASGDGTIEFWDVASGRRRRVLDGPHGYAVTSVAFSPDGQTLASGYEDHTIRLWGVASGSLRMLSGYGDSVSPVAFSPDGRTLVSGSRQQHD